MTCYNDLRNRWHWLRDKLEKHKTCVHYSSLVFAIWMTKHLISCPWNVGQRSKLQVSKLLRSPVALLNCQYRVYALIFNQKYQVPSEWEIIMQNAKKKCQIWGLAFGFDQSSCLKSISPRTAGRLLTAVWRDDSAGMTWLWTHASNDIAVTNGTTMAIEPNTYQL